MKLGARWDLPWPESAVSGDLTPDPMSPQFCPLLYAPKPVPRSWAEGSPAPRPFRPVRLAPSVPGTRSPAAGHSSASPSHSTRSRSNGHSRPGAMVSVPRAQRSATAGGLRDHQRQPRPRPRLPGQTPRVGPPSGPPLGAPPRLAR